MKVICEINNFRELEDVSTISGIERYLRSPSGQLSLEKGSEYPVFGIIFRNNSPWLYIYLDDDLYPTAYPIELFTVSDDKIPSYWKLSHTRFSSGEIESALLFEEWATDRYLLERALDGDPAALKIFEEYRAIMNKE